MSLSLWLIEASAKRIPVTTKVGCRNKLKSRMSDILENIDLSLTGHVEIRRLAYRVLVEVMVATEPAVPDMSVDTAAAIVVVAAGRWI